MFELNQKVCVCHSKFRQTYGYSPVTFFGQVGIISGRSVNPVFRYDDEQMIRNYAVVFEDIGTLIYYEDHLIAAT